MGSGRRGRSVKESATEWKRQRWRLITFLAGTEPRCDPQAGSADRAKSSVVQKIFVYTSALTLNPKTVAIMKTSGFLHSVWSPNILQKHQNILNGCSLHCTIKAMFSSDARESKRIVCRTLNSDGFTLYSSCHSHLGDNFCPVINRHTLGTRWLCDQVGVKMTNKCQFVNRDWYCNSDLIV